MACGPAGSLDGAHLRMTRLSFNCANANLNTLLLSSATSVPYMVALAATVTNDGIVNIPGTSDTRAFAVATVNVGASGKIHGIGRHRECNPAGEHLCVKLTRPTVNASQRSVPASPLRSTPTPRRRSRSLSKVTALSRSIRLPIGSSSASRRGGGHPGFDERRGAHAVRRAPQVGHRH